MSEHKFREYLTDTNYYDKGVQHLYKFPNDYGASVIKTDYSYGGKSGLWEIAVYDYSIDKSGEITYHTPITQDVIGHLSWVNVEKTLEEIFKL